MVVWDQLSVIRDLVIGYSGQGSEIRNQELGIITTVKRENGLRVTRFELRVTGYGLLLAKICAGGCFCSFRGLSMFGWFLFH